MKRNIVLWQVIGFFAVSLMGTLLHFLFDITESIALSLISSVNESTWEHMKILFFPMLILAIAEGFVFGKECGYLCIKLKGILLGVILIPTLFYTLTGAFGTLPDFVNITIFFVSAAIALIYETKQFKSGEAECQYSRAAVALLCLIAALFMLFTFIPPIIPLFEDPIDSSYGIFALLGK